MGSRNAGLTADPLFVGATRPPIRWGVTYAALLLNLVSTIAQVSSTYGSGEAQTIVENCGNTLILRCSGSEHGGTSYFASRLIGQREVIRTTQSRSRRPTELLPSITRSEHFSIEPAVMGSEIEQLADLTGYLKFASHPEWIRIGLARGALAADNSAGQASAARDGFDYE